mmetsp:Transcript_12516/g.13875  ORF Transcript_12516/g.13875 Transcript_12516/m.13875 type:complete len:136 (+) Transcript_12516:51-458(+)
MLVHESYLVLLLIGMYIKVYPILDLIVQPLLYCIGNINGTSNINAAVAAVTAVVDDDDDDDDDDEDEDDSDSDTDDDMPELEECRHINNRSWHIIGNRRMFVSHQINISQGTNHGIADEENQSDSSEDPVVELPQ